MILALITAGVVLALLSLPGWIIVANDRRPIWVYAAAGVCSQFAVILCTALISLATPGQLDVRTALIVAVVASIAALARYRPSGGSLLERLDPWAFVTPLIATAAAALITRSAIDYSSGELLVRAWFNADGFKHLGHVQALAAFGLPAKDIFAGGADLAYYWFFYAIPSLGAAIHGDAAKALVFSGLFQTFAFWLIVHGLLRGVGANGWWAAVVGLIGWLSPSLDGMTTFLGTHWDLAKAATGVDIEAVNAQVLQGGTLFRASLYLPQHQFMLAGLLSWFVLDAASKAEPTRLQRLLASAPLVCAGAVSTLLGVLCLGVFALARLLDNRRSFVARGLEVAAIGLAALSVPLLFGVVDLTSSHTSGLASPIFSADPYERALVQRLLLAPLGLVMLYGVSLLGLLGLNAGLRDRTITDERRRTLLFALALVSVGGAALLGLAVLDSPRIAKELQLRAALLAGLGLMIASGHLLLAARDGRYVTRQGMAMIGTPLLALGIATPMLDAAWHSGSTDRLVVRIPADDMAVLKQIRDVTPRQSVVLQYPEMPFVVKGRDVWTPILAGRMVYTSPRATDWEGQVAQLKAATAFFKDQGPLPAGRYGYVYLSRALHPASYDQLMRRMASTGGWRAIFCKPDACLWRRDQSAFRKTGLHPASGERAQVPLKRQRHDEDQAIADERNQPHRQEEEKRGLDARQSGQ
jgi:hypothetical protein